MNTKILMSFLAGAVAGGAGMYVYLTKYKKIEYEVIEPKIEPEVEENVVEDGNVVEEVSEAELSDDPTSENDFMAYYKERGASDEPVIDYRSFSKEIERAKDGAEIIRVDVSKIVKDRGPMKFEITEEQAMYREEEFDTAIISLYDDGAVVDETNGMEVRYEEEEVDDFIGAALIEEFANDSEKDDLFVENVMYGTIYEIHKRHGNYSQDYIDEVEDEEQ